MKHHRHPKWNIQSILGASCLSWLVQAWPYVSSEFRIWRHSMWPCLNIRGLQTHKARGGNQILCPRLMNLMQPVEEVDGGPKVDKESMKNWSKLKSKLHHLFDCFLLFSLRFRSQLGPHNWSKNDQRIRIFLDWFYINLYWHLQVLSSQIFKHWVFVHKRFRFSWLRFWHLHVKPRFDSIREQSWSSKIDETSVRNWFKQIDRERDWLIKPSGIPSGL